MGSKASLTSKPTLPRPVLPRLLLALGVAGVLISGCEPEPETREAPDIPPRIAVSPVGFMELPGWSDDAVSEAVPAFLRSCQPVLNMAPDRIVGRPPIAGEAADFVPACQAAAELPPGDTVAARAFFESYFQPFLVGNGTTSDGLFTGYFEIEVRGALESDTRFDVPVYRVPDDHITVRLGDFDPALSGRSLIGRVENGRLKPYYERREIQDGVLHGRGLELVWLDDTLDAFMLHIQGSGRVTLPDGRTTRIGYAGNNGFPYRSIGSELIARGALRPDTASWQSIRSWIEANPDQAAALLAVNQRYIFFEEIIGDGPIGAQGVPLTPGRSLAVDPEFVPLGVPLWLDTMWPGAEEKPLRRLVIAQDTGAAIKGPVRGDFFWGTGDEALALAGRMKHRGSYYVLLPHATAERLTSS